MDSLKCYNCGKVFKCDADLLRHKRRKTPCLIRELKPGDENKPYCIFCNRVYTSMSNLGKHYGICKIKNGGMKILADKAEQNTKRSNTDDRLDILIGLNKELVEQNRQLIEKLNKAQNITNNLNLTNNTTINFTVIEAPKIDTLQFQPHDALGADIVISLLRSIYFNERIPQNHIMYAVDEREGKLMIYKGPDIKWLTSHYKDFMPELQAAIKTAIEIGKKKYVGPDGLFKSLDDLIKQPDPIRNNLLDIVAPIKKDNHTIEDVFNLAIKEKTLIQQTLQKAGIEV